MKETCYSFSVLIAVNQNGPFLVFLDLNVSWIFEEMLKCCHAISSCVVGGEQWYIYLPGFEMER